MRAPQSGGASVLGAVLIGAAAPVPAFEEVDVEVEGLMVAAAPPAFAGFAEVLIARGAPLPLTGFAADFAVVEATAPALDVVVVGPLAVAGFTFLSCSGFEAISRVFLGGRVREMEPS